MQMCYKIMVLHFAVNFNYYHSGISGAFRGMDQIHTDLVSDGEQVQVGFGKVSKVHGKESLEYIQEICLRLFGSTKQDTNLICVVFTMFHKDIVFSNNWMLVY